MTHDVLDARTIWYEYSASRLRVSTFAQIVDDAVRADPAVIGRVHRDVSRSEKWHEWMRSVL